MIKFNSWVHNAPLGCLEGRCYFCRAQTPFIYKSVRLCYKHDTADTRAVIDVQNVHLEPETKPERDVMQKYDSGFSLY